MFTLFYNFSKRWKMLRDNITKVSDKNSIEKLPKRWMRVTRFTLLAYDKFEQKRCFMRAAALSFNSLLALIPILALTVSLTSWIVKDTGTQSLEKLVDKIIIIIMPANSSNKDIEEITESLASQITKFIKNLMDNNLLTIRAAENVVRILPPLNVKKNELDLALKIIEKVCSQIK